MSFLSSAFQSGFNFSFFHPQKCLRPILLITLFKKLQTAAVQYLPINAVFSLPCIMKARCKHLLLPSPRASSPPSDLYFLTFLTRFSTRLSPLSLNCSHCMLSALQGAAVNKKLLTASPESTLCSKAAHESLWPLLSVHTGWGCFFVQNHLTSRSLTWKGKYHRLGGVCRGLAQFLADNRQFSMYSNCSPHPAA